MDSRLRHLHLPLLRSRDHRHRLRGPRHLQNLLPVVAVVHGPHPGGVQAHGRKVAAAVLL